MKSNTLNMARRPFANQAPVLRVGVLLAVLSLTLLLFNVERYRNYFSGRGKEARHQLTEIAGQMRSLDKELVALQRQLAGYDIGSLNTRIAFLNLRIRERVFGWGRLFEDLEAVIPADVRLLRLSPRQIDGGDGDGRVALTIQGVARTEEGLLNLIDAMFDHRRFVDPSPDRQTERNNQHEFNLTVIYLPPPADGGRRAPAASPGEEGS